MARKVKATSQKRKLNTEMRDLGKRLDGLIAQARKGEVKVRAQSVKQIRALKIKQAAAKKTLARLARQSAAASGPMKTGLRKAWRDIESAVRQATRRFRATE